MDNSADIPERLHLLGPRLEPKEVTCSNGQVNEKPIAQKASIHSSPTAPEELYFGNTGYAGDIVDNTPVTENRTLPFANSALLMATYNKAIRSQRAYIYPWQLDVSQELCQPAKQPTSQHPLRYCLVANNGSGKDSFVIAPFAIWFILTKMKARCIITTSSGTQMTGQTESYIRGLANAVNEEMGCEVFRVRQRYIKCLWTGSEIRMFVTDEAGKAEGYHPIEPDSEMCIIVNEGKSVSGDIYTALRRCTGYNYWIEVSSPGEPSGDFYESFSDERLGYLTKQVTSFDCPNISEEEREADKIRYGEGSAYYRSKHLALFTSLGGEVIIPIEIVNRLLASPPQLQFTTSKLQVKRVGIDLSAGGDEVVISVTRGNKQVAERTLRDENDTTKIAAWINSQLGQLEIPHDHDFIFADDGGVGHAIVDMLVHNYKWAIKRIHNQSPAVYKLHFGNRGAEAWDRIKRLFEENIWNPVGMSKLCIAQLTQRKVKDKLVGAKMYLQSKKEARAQGQKSPDRADAFILSLTGLTLEDFQQGSRPVVEAPKVGRQDNVVQQQLEEYYDNEIVYSSYNNMASKERATAGKRVFGSLNRAMRTQREFDN